MPHVSPYDWPQCYIASPTEDRVVGGVINGNISAFYSNSYCPCPLQHEIVRFKYLQKDTVSSVRHKTEYPIWTELLKVKNIYLQDRKLKEGDGKNTLFGKESWLYSDYLYLLFPDLFKLCEQQNISVYQLISGATHISFQQMHG
jgi:hypothetical protein